MSCARLVTSTLVIALFAAENGESAKYAGEFLRLGMGARSWSMGGTSVASTFDATAAYWNPANLAHVRRHDAMLMHAETFGSLLNYDAAALALPAERAGRAMTFGFAVLRLGGGGIQRTALANPSLPISDTNRVVRAGEAVGHSDWAAYASAGTRLGEHVNVGATAKLIYRDIVDATAFGFGFDAGVQYSPHPNWNAAVVVYDVTTSLLAYDNGYKESVLPRAVAGLAFHPAWERFTLLVTAEGVMEFEGRQSAAQFYQGAVSLDLRSGAEIVYRKIVALRAGMDAEDPTLGAGVKFSAFSLDGAWRNHDVLDDSYRFSLSYSW